MSEVVLAEWGSPAEGSVLSSRSAEVGLRAALADPRVRSCAHRARPNELLGVPTRGADVSRRDDPQGGRHTRTLRLSLSLSLTLPAPGPFPKVDADTWLAPEFLERQLWAREFLRGCRDRATDENGRHLAGVVLVRRSTMWALAHP